MLISLIHFISAYSKECLNVEKKTEKLEIGIVPEHNISVLYCLRSGSVMQNEDGNDSSQLYPNKNMHRTVYDIAC